MPVKFVNKFKIGWTAIIEADEGHLLGGRMVESGPVFDRFFEALYYMNIVIEENEKARRSVKLGKVVLFEGMVSCFTNVHDNEEGEP